MPKGGLDPQKPRIVSQKPLVLDFMVLNQHSTNTHWWYLARTFEPFGTQEVLTLSAYKTDVFVFFYKTRDFLLELKFY